jgi:hypothetical protein
MRSGVVCVYNEHWPTASQSPQFFNVVRFCGEKRIIHPQVIKELWGLVYGIENVITAVPGDKALRLPLLYRAQRSYTD